MSRFLALCFDQSAVYRRDLGEVIVRRAEMPLGRKPRRQESALYLQLLVDSDIHLPVFRSADLHSGQLSQHRDYGEITGGQNVLWPDLYKGMSRTFFSLRRRRGYCSRHPAPVSYERRLVRVLCPADLVAWVVPSQQFHSGSDDATQFLKPASPVVVRCQPWFYLRLVAYCFFGLSEGA